MLVDNPAAATELSCVLIHDGVQAHAVLDLDVGQHRTGIAPGPEAVKLYALLAHLPGLIPDGLSAYDGHNHQVDLSEREAAVGQDSSSP